MLTSSALRLSRPTKEFFARSFCRANYATGSWLMFAGRASRTEQHELNRVFLSTSAVQNQQAHEKLPHFRTKKGIEEDDRTKGDEDYRMAHPIWTKEDLEGIQITHREPKTFVDKLAYFLVQTFRVSFDIFSLYKIGKMTEAKWLNRIIMLETIAGVPGMIGGMARHLKSLRSLSRDHGWIHTLLEEAENERMHLMTALELKNPGIMFKGLIIIAQGVYPVPALSLLPFMPGNRTDCCEFA